MLAQKSKLAEAILYIAEKSKSDPKFGKTKLFKILFLADFNRYGSMGKSITDTPYIHLTQGPVPKDAEYLIQSLQDEGRLRITHKQVGEYTQHRIEPLTGYDLSGFTQDEIDTIDESIEDVKRLNATDLSNWTHTLLPWINTVMREEIPYFTIFVLRKLPVEKDVFLWAQKELETLRQQEQYGG